MDFQKSKYKFTVIRNVYGEFKVNSFTRYVNRLNKTNELTSIMEDIKKDKNVIDVTYEKLDVGNDKTVDIMVNELKRKSIQISSNEMEFSELFSVARELNRYAEAEGLGVTIIAVKPK